METGKSQVDRIPRQDAGDYKIKTGNSQVVGGTHVGVGTVAVTVLGASVWYGGAGLDTWGREAARE